MVQHKKRRYDLISTGPFSLIFSGAKITSDAEFLLMREVDQRFGIIESGCSQLVDNRSASHKKHTFEQMIRQRVYQMAAGYEDCNEADYLRIDLVIEVFSKRT